MSRKVLGIITALIMLCAVHTVAGQELNGKITSPAAAPVITGAASTERLRFTAPSSVVQMQLQIYAESGQLLFDVTSKGNVLDWTLQDSGGQYLVPGSYLCVVTVKSLSGKLTQRIGSAFVQEKQVGLQRVEATQLTLAQQQAVGPIEENGAVAILNADEAQATTVLANNGTEGQMIRGRGALTFRLGNFFSGTDREQMRLTEDGRLGIGTDNPQATLDVAGSLRTTKGIEFADGTVQTTGLSGHKDANGNMVPNASGAGTQNRIAKWTDNVGTLGDSLLNENGGAIEVRSPGAGPGVTPSILNPNSVAAFAQFQFYPATGPNANMSFTVVPRGTGVASNKAQFSIFGTDYFADPTNYEFASLRARGTDFVLGSGKSGTGQARPFMIASGFLSDNTTNNGQLYLATDGKVGVGRTDPSFKLDVLGDIDTSTFYRINGNRVLNSGNAGSFSAGPGAGNINTGGVNTFFGFFAGGSNLTSDDNTFIGAQAGYSNQTGFHNSFLGSSAGIFSTGSRNTMVGSTSGQNNAAGSSNVFVGILAGAANTSGSFNTILGSDANVGANNLDHAAAIGANATVSTSNTIALGRANGSDTVNIPGALNVNTVNVTTQYNINGNRVLGMNGDDPDFGPSNTFAGYQAGQATTPGNTFSSYFGSAAGLSATGNNNSFFGGISGLATSSGTNNSFFGVMAGSSNTTGNGNTAIGNDANFGAGNLTNATAIGANAKVTQSNSLVLGSINGINLATADTNVGIGTTAPLNILHLSGNRSDFALTFTNQANTAGKRGYRISFDNDRLTFQRADDSGSFAANQMAIDQASGNVGIGTTAPHAKLQVAGGNIYVTNPNGVIISSLNGTCWQIGVSNVGALTTIATPCP